MVSWYREDLPQPDSIDQEIHRWKTWLRSSIGNDRLSGLAMMHVHRNRALDPEKVLKRWDASGHRRIVLAFDRK
ncbi:hypothetical protein KUCAC02_004694 [Chaenocephalus aceratus]|uniref:Uncharacterized protein n=1 Tax=Chaenocephalus aceratus TaxID=36190 RepID=A0ACB9X0I0_CHAAC|nr:hypothetical protein KUCAC02_004694 [Chaenocephalus aceratus]